MNKLIAAAITSLSLAVMPAYADGGHGRGYYGPPHGNYSHHGDRNALLAGVAVIGAIAGLAMLTNHSQPVNAAPAPVYVEPSYQVPSSYALPQPAQNVWYYCASSAMYYPYTKVCPEGWQAVPTGSF